MQEIIIPKPYQFVPPVTGRFWAAVIARFVDGYMRRSYQVSGYECRGIEKLRDSIRNGHGVLIAPNHTRPCDPMAFGWLTRELPHPFYCMASWHLFMGSHTDRWLIRRCGAFSVYREGTDHTSLNFAVQSLVKPDRPVIVFPEGALNRSNDVVRPLLDGAALIARVAAKKRSKQNPTGKVVIHPIGLKYFFHGDLEGTLVPVLDRLERQIGWEPQSGLPLAERVRKLGRALLCLREVEYFGQPQVPENDTADIHDRVDQLIEHILKPLEQEYTEGTDRPNGLYARVQQLRSRILPDLVADSLDDAQRDRRWRQLRDCYVVQTLGCYPRGYLGNDPTAERLIETVERFEEDLTDTATVHGPLHLVFQVGDAIQVSTRRERGAKTDPLTATIHKSLSDIIEQINANPPANEAHQA